MVLTSAQTTRLLVIIAFVLAAQANQKLWVHIQSQRNLSRLVVEQIQKAFDAVAVLDRKVSSHEVSLVSNEKATVETKPVVVKDPWSFASSWIAFVQNSKDRFVGVLGAQKTLTRDSSLDLVLNVLTEPEERVRQALIWSETSTDEQRNAIQLVIVNETIAKDISAKNKDSEDVKASVNEVKIHISEAAVPPAEVPVEAPPESVLEPSPEVFEAVQEPEKEKPKKKKKVALKKPEVVLGL